MSYGVEKFDIFITTISFIVTNLPLTYVELSTHEVISFFTNYFILYHYILILLIELWKVSERVSAPFLLEEKCS